MRCSQRLASLAMVSFGLMFLAAGCKKEPPAQPTEDTSAFLQVAIEITGMS